MATFLAGQKLRASDMQLLPVVKTKLADQTISNTTVQTAITDLAVPLNASTTYSFRAIVWYSSTTTADFAPGLTVPAGATFRVCPHGSPATINGLSSTEMWVGTFTSNPMGTFGGKGAGAGNSAMLMLEGTVNVSGSPGNLQLTFAQGVAEVSNTVVHATSSLTVQKVG